MKRLLAIAALALVAMQPHATFAQANVTVRVTNSSVTCARMDIVAMAYGAEPNPHDMRTNPMPAGVLKPVGTVHQLWAHPGQTVELSSAQFSTGVLLHAHYGHGTGCLMGSTLSYSVTPGPGSTVHVYFRGGPSGYTFGK